MGELVSEQNPYQSPRAIRPRKMNWTAVVLRLIGSLMLLWWIDLVFRSGIISLNLLGISLLLLLGPSIPDLVRAPTKREVLREMQRREAGDPDEAAETSPSPEDFLSQLEQEDTAQSRIKKISD